MIKYNLCRQYLLEFLPKDMEKLPKGIYTLKDIKYTIIKDKTNRKLKITNLTVIFLEINTNKEIIITDNTIYNTFHYNTNFTSINKFKNKTDYELEITKKNSRQKVKFLMGKPLKLFKIRKEKCK